MHKTYHLKSNSNKREHISATKTNLVINITVETHTRYW